MRCCKRHTDQSVAAKVLFHHENQSQHQKHVGSVHTLLENLVRFFTKWERTEKRLSRVVNGLWEEDSVRCRALAKALPLDGQGMNHSRTEQGMEGKMP